MKRGGPLRRGKPLERKTPLRAAPGSSWGSGRNGAALKRTPFKARPTPDPITSAVRASVHRRSGGYCEARATSGCSGVGVHLHHRKLRRHGDHSAANLLDVCSTCHNAIHANVATSLRRGMLVRSHEDPAEVAVVPGW